VSTGIALIDRPEFAFRAMASYTRRVRRQAVRSALSGRLCPTCAQVGLCADPICGGPIVNRKYSVRSLRVWTGC